MTHLRTVVRRASLMLLCALATLPALAQTPDTTAAARYWPLAVGNEWHHSGSYTPSYPPNQYSYRVQQRVVAVVPGSPERFLTDWVRVQTSAMGTTTTSGTDTLQFDPVTQRVEGAATPCPLGAPFNAPVPCAAGQSFYVTGGYGQPVSVGGESVVTSRKQFRFEVSHPNGFYSVRHVYAAGLGEVEYSLGQVSGPDQVSATRTLAFARIGGVEYGVPLSFPTVGETAPADAVLTLGAYPNPTAASATITYTLTAPASVRLTLTDVLGRDVAAVTEGERAAGRHTATLDARRLAPGVYTVWLVTGDAVATRRLTVAR